MAIDADTLEKLRTETAEPPSVDLSWLNLDENGHPWGMRAKPGKRGLTLDEIEIGKVGEVPEQSDNRSVRVRGSVPRARMLASSTKKQSSASGHRPPTSPGKASRRCRTTSSGPCASSAPS
jgi:hypothetical protein